MRLGRVQTGLNLLVGFVFQRPNLCLDACRSRLKFMGSPGVSVSQLYCPHSFDTRHEGSYERNQNRRVWMEQAGAPPATSASCADPGPSSPAPAA